MSKYLIKLGRNGEAKEIDLVPEETCVFYNIISEYYNGSDDSGYIIKIPDFDIQDMKKHLTDDIQDSVVKYCIRRAYDFEEEMCLGAYDDLVKYFVNKIKNS